MGEKKMAIVLVIACVYIERSGLCASLSGNTLGVGKLLRPYQLQGQLAKLHVGPDAKE